MNNNVCRFVPKTEDSEALHIVNLVYETKCSQEVRFRHLGTYRLHYVTNGKGRLQNEQGSFEISQGDLFLIPPATQFSLENTDNLKYIYISYTGIRANTLFDQISSGQFNGIFPDFSDLLPLWDSAFSVPNTYSNMRCESIILYTFSEICKRMFIEPSAGSSAKAAQSIKKYIDDNFSDTTLCLDKIGTSLSYHPKYISTVFKKEFKIGIADYIMLIRIQHACTLMEQGFTSLKSIAAMCGFKDSLYFSRVFKARMNQTPSEHLREIAESSASEKLSDE